MKSKFKLIFPLWVRSVAVVAVVAGLAPAQTDINPAARKHVKLIGGQPFKYSSKLAKVIELNFTFGFHHSDSKPLIAATLTRVATNYGTGGVPAFTVQRHIGPSNGTASGVPTPDFTLTDLLSGQVIFANQISAMGNSALGTTRQQAIQQAIEVEGRGYFALHGSGDNEATGWPWYTNTLHPMNYQGHGDRTPGPVYKNPVEKEHIVTENVLTTGMLAPSSVPTSVNGTTEVLTSEPTRNITNEWYRFGTDIRTNPTLAARLTVLSLYDPRNLTSNALGATYKRKGGNMYTYLFKVGNGMTHYLPAGHDNSEIMAAGGFDGGVGDWDRYFAQVLFFLAGYNVTACDTSCNGLPVVTSENRLTGKNYTSTGIHGEYGFSARELSFNSSIPAFSYPRAADYEVKLMSVSGKVLAAKKGHGSQYAFDRTSLTPGVYMLSVRINNMVPTTKRYVIGAQL